MISNTNTNKIKYTEPIAILISKEEKIILEKLKSEFKGTGSQIFRFGLSKLAKKYLENETRTNTQ